MKRIIYLAVIAFMVGANAGYAQKKQESDYNYQRANELHEQKGDDAVLLLGQSVLECFGIITNDNINSKLIIKQR